MDLKKVTYHPSLKLRLLYLVGVSHSHLTFSDIFLPFSSTHWLKWAHVYDHVILLATMVCLMIMVTCLTTTIKTVLKLSPVTWCLDLQSLHNLRPKFQSQLCLSQGLPVRPLDVVNFESLLRSITISSK